MLNNIFFLPQNRTFELNMIKMPRKIEREREREGMRHEKEIMKWNRGDEKMKRIMLVNYLL